MTILKTEKENPDKDNARDRGEVRSLSYMAVKKYLYFAANDDLPRRLIEDADKLQTGLDGMSFYMCNFWHHMIPKTLILITGSDILKMNQTKEIKSKETKPEVQTYLDRLIYAIQSESVKIHFERDRNVDRNRDKKYSNRYTMSQLFPDEDEIQALKRELALLTVEDYIETVKDTRFPKRSGMWVFGKQYSGDDVYIKIRVELISVEHASGGSYIFVMSFHYSEWGFKESDFPYKIV